MVNTLKKTRGLFLIGVKRYNAYNNRIFFWNTCITFFADYFPALARDGPSWNWPCAVPRLGGRKPSSDVIYQPRPELARDRWHDWRLHQNRNGAGTGGVSPGTSSYCNWRIHLRLIKAVGIQQYMLWKSTKAELCALGRLIGMNVYF